MSSREKKTVRLNFRLTKAELDRLKAAAVVLNMTVSEIIRAGIARLTQGVSNRKTNGQVEQGEGEAEETV